MTEAGKVILVTGAGTGIGARAARRLCERGHRVWATMRDPAGRHRKVCEEFEGLRAEGFRVEVFELDVASTSSIVRALDAVCSAEGRLDVVVNNAGVLPFGVTEAFSVDQFESCLRVNVLGAYALARAALVRMSEQGSGRLLHIGSIASHVVFPFLSLYCAAKHALFSLMDGFWEEAREEGVESVFVSPGMMATPLYQTSPQPARQEVASGYGAVSDRQVQMTLALERIVLDDPEAVDPNLVVDLLFHLVEAPAKEVPRHAFVGATWGAEEIYGLKASLRDARCGRRW